MQGPLWLWKLWTVGPGCRYDVGHGGHCNGRSLVDADTELVPDWHVDTYVYSLGGMIL